MITIKNYISMIYDDFREYIDQNVNLCMLKNIKLSSWTKAGLFRHTYSTIIFVTVCFFICL